MLKLFVTILAISSSGSVTSSVTVTDMQDPVACGLFEKKINEAKPVTLNNSGFIATATMNAKCVTDGPTDPALASARNGQVVIPLGDMFSSFGRSLQGK